MERSQKIYAAVKKKSGHPTQPGNRSTASKPTNKGRKRGTILHRIQREIKRYPVVYSFLFITAFVALCIILCCAINWPTTDNVAGVLEKAPQEVTTVYIFRDGDGYPVDWQAVTRAWSAEAGFDGKRYELTDAERWELASVVTAEAEGEPYAGKVAVAQCILQACEDDGIRPSTVLSKYDYVGKRPEPSAEALEAVQAVFDFGHVATAEPIKYFYNPERCQSDWHESQVYIMTINGHKFFKEAE